MRKMTVELSFEIDDENKTFAYTLKHHGDGVYNNELVELLRMTADDLEARAAGGDAASEGSDD